PAAGDRQVRGPVRDPLRPQRVRPRSRGRGHRLPPELAGRARDGDVAAGGVAGHVRTGVCEQAPGISGPQAGGHAHQPAQLGRQGQARGTVPHPEHGDGLMGALARLLGRRGSGGAAPGSQADPASAGGVATATRPRRARAPADLLHASGMSTDELRACWIAVSWLLTYPDEQLIQRMPQIRELATALPTSARDALLRTVDQLTRRDAISLQEEYVDTFDTRRRGCLYLT